MKNGSDYNYDNRNIFLIISYTDIPLRLTRSWWRQTR